MNHDRQPVDTRLQTPHLDLVPLRVDHASEMTEVLADPSLYDHIGGKPPTRADLLRRYTAQVEGDPDGSQWWLTWVLRHRGSGTLVGFVQATVEPGTSHATAEVAWVVGARFQGRGAATEAARAVTDWLSVQGVGTVVAHVHPRNVASQVVATRIGMRPTSVVVDDETRWELTLTPAP